MSFVLPASATSRRYSATNVNTPRRSAVVTAFTIRTHGCAVTAQTHLGAARLHDTTAECRETAAGRRRNDAASCLHAAQGDHLFEGAPV